MRNINTTTLSGRATKDPDITEKDTFTVANFSLAVNYDGRTDFFEVVAFNGLATKVVSPHVTKGKQVTVSGHLRQDRWEKDGRTHSRVRLVAEKITLGASPKKGGK